MSLSLSIAERLSRARGDLRMGVPVVLCGTGGAALVAAVEALDAGRLAELHRHGPAVLAITARRASMPPTIRPGRWQASLLPAR